MPVNIQIIEDDIDEIRLDDINNLDVQAMGNVYIKYADSNNPEIIYDDPVTDEHIHAYIGIYIGIQEPISIEAYNWCVRDLTAIENAIADLVENKQDKLSDSQMNAVNSGITDQKVNSYDSHLINKENPHEVTKEQIGLGSVVNTGDSDTPVENGTDKFTTGGAYHLQQNINEKQDTLVSGENIKTINGINVLGSGNIVVGFDPETLNNMLCYDYIDEEDEENE